MRGIEPHILLNHTQLEADPRNFGVEVVQSEGHMEVDEPASARQPVRHLEDEQSHLHCGTLRLTDFEVKGTLGA